MPRTKRLDIFSFFFASKKSLRLLAKALVLALQIEVLDEKIHKAELETLKKTTNFTCMSFAIMPDPVRRAKKVYDYLKIGFLEREKNKSWLASSWV